MARNLAASVLLAIGMLFLVATAGLLGRAYLGQWILDRGWPVVEKEALPARMGDPVVMSIPSAGDVAPAAPSPPDLPPRGTPTPLPEPSPTPLPDFGPPVRLVIPSIEVDAPVARMGVRDGVYEVPWWDVGWHEDSARLGTPGNTVFNGHLDTIDAGRVFARLHQMQPGDMIYAYSEEYRTAWVVESSERVPNTERDFVVPTDDVRVTLYTCEGKFNWQTRRYSHFRVVVGRLVKATARTEAR